MQKPNSAFAKLETLQTLLPLGYIYLIVLGIIKESIAFFQVGINIMNYTTITDILVSPIAVATVHPIALFALILLGYYPVWLRKTFLNRSHEPWVRKWTGIKHNAQDMTPEDAHAYANRLMISTFAATFFFMYCGFAWQQGREVANSIRENKVEITHKLTFNDGDTTSVKIIGTNTEYCFYATPNSRTVKIAPIGGLKLIEVIKNKRLK